MKIILCDLDKVLLERYRNRPQMASLVVFAEIFQLLHQAKDQVRIIFLSDRSVPQLAPLTYLFNGDRFQAGESGAALYDRNTHTVIINSCFRSFVKEVRPEIIKRINDSLLNLVSLFEPGCTVCVNIEDSTLETYEKVKKALKGLPVKIEKGSAISIRPADLSKIDGLKMLFDFYGGICRPLNFKDSVWIADGDRDIVVAECVAENGGIVCSVGNGSKNYKETIKKLGGFIAVKTHEEGVLEILRRYLNERW